MSCALQCMQSVVSTIVPVCVRVSGTHGNPIDVAGDCKDLSCRTPLVTYSFANIIIYVHPNNNCFFLNFKIYITHSYTI